MRNVSQQMIDEFASKAVKPILMAELYFDSGTSYVFTGLGQLVWNDKTFVGGGSFIGVSNIQETQDNKANGIVVSLNGISSTLVAASLTERARGRPFRLYLAAKTTTQYVITEEEESAGSNYVLLESGGKVRLENTLVQSPLRIFSGLMDVMEFVDDAVTADIKLSVENILIIGQRAKIGRYTSEDQKKRYPSDQGLDFINNLQDKSIVW